MNSLAVLVIFGLISAISCSPISKATFKNVGIVGGNDTTIEANPWQVSIQLLGLHSCGGSIIGPDTIVTAAHCIDPLMPILYSVFLGTNNLLSNDSQRVGIKQAFYHEKWDGYDYDVGIIKLAENLTYSDQVKPIKMVESGKTPLNGSEVNVTGWGVTSEGALLPPIILQGVTVNVVDHEECAKDLEEFQEVTERMLCAAVPEGGKDSCQGDSGGPLTQNGVLVGIVSWGMGCAEKDYPGVYADVAALRDWIKQKTGI